MIAPNPNAWQRELLAEWTLPPRCGGNEWAETYRILGSDENSQDPGPWRSVHWQREILDAFGDPQLDWIVVKKASQVGISELVRNAIGRWAMLDPGPVLWVMANELAARKAMKKLRKMFKNTPALRRLVSSRSSDSTLLEMVLTNGMRIVVGWSGSPQSLASDPFRYVVGDEVALWEWSSKGEGSPVRLCEDRTKIFGHRAKVILLSKPKDQGDLITDQFESCLDRRSFAVPCPSCRVRQVVEFDSVCWPGGTYETVPTDREARKLAEAQVQAAQSAWYSCSSCPDGRIADMERAVCDPSSGWVREDLGGVVSDTVTLRKRGYHVTEVYHWSTTPSALLARWLSCHSAKELQVFWCGSLGTAMVTVRSEIPVGVFERRAIHRRREVPAWSSAVIGTADTQKNGWWFLLRSWGAGRRSRTLDWGWVTSLEELHERTLGASFPVAGTSRRVRPQSLHIDTGGGRTPDGNSLRDLYHWILETPGAFALKGEGERGSGDAPIRWTKQQIGDEVLRLCRPNTNYFKDQAAALIRADKPVVWEECLGSELPDYARQMTGQRLTYEETPNGKGRWRWRKRTGRADHLWDCSAYQLVAVEELDLGGISTLVGELANKQRVAEEVRGDSAEPAWVDGSDWWD